MTDKPRPRPVPGDPDYIARFTLPQEVLDYAFGTNGGTPPPRVARRPSSTRPAAASDSTTPAAAEPQ